MAKKHPDPKNMTAYDAYEYARDVIKGRWPEAEPYIMKDAEQAYAYALYVIKGRWPEAEPYIMQSASAAYWYAHDVIKGRWPKAEPYIMKSAETAYEYAVHCIVKPYEEKAKLEQEIKEAQAKLDALKAKAKSA